MPTYKNTSNALLYIEGKAFQPGETTVVEFYAPPSLTGKLQMESIEPCVTGPILSAVYVTDDVYNIPYTMGLIIVSIKAYDDVTISFGDAGVILNLAAGEIYQTIPLEWDLLGKVTVTGTAYIITERGR